MKIALIRKECTFSKGGAERYCANLACAWAEMGHDIFFLGEKCDSDLHPGIVHIPIHVNKLTSASKNRSFHLNCQKALKTIRVDKTYALSRTYPVDSFRVSDPLHYFWMGIRYPGKLQNLLQRLNPRHSTILKLENNIFNVDNTRAIITNSSLTKNQVLRFFPYPSSRIHVLYNGVDLNKFTPAPEKESYDRNKLELLFVGQDFHRKGLRELLEAAAILRRQGIAVNLVVVGGDHADSFRQLASRLDIIQHVKFAGKSDQVEFFYKAADLMVFPTQYDPFANVCLEALACGLPVVTTSSNGAAEILEEGRDGFVVSPGHAAVQGIVAKVMDFSSRSVQNKLAMKCTARKKAENFTVAKNAEQTLEILLNC